MKLGEVILGGIALFGVGYGLTVYDREHKGQQARNLRLKISGVNYQDGDMVMNIQILNPNSQDMQVQSFVGEMLVNNIVVATIKMFGDYTAKANNEITMPLIMKPRAGNLFNQVINFIKNGGARIKYVGTINVNNNAIPLVMSYNK